MKSFYTLSWFQHSSNTVYGEKKALGKPALPQPVSWDLFFPVLSTGHLITGPVLRAPVHIVFFQTLKPEKMLFKGLTETVLGVWKTSQKFVSRPFDCAIFRKLIVSF